jgi:hypothetical protein
MEVNMKTSELPERPTCDEVPEENAEEILDRIDINDLADCVKVIDMCSERGAFKGGELSGVGELRNRLVKFVNAVVTARNEEVGIEDETVVKTETDEEL